MRFTLHHQSVNMAGNSMNDVDKFLLQDFDFLVAGGGTAGLVLANRLSESPGFTIGVIEAGPNRLDDPMVDTPAMATQMTGNKDYDWHFVTVPQGPSGVRSHIPRGKMLGGSSGINWMVYTRPSTRDFDDWAALVGDPSWSSASMKKYQLKHQYLEPLADTITDRTALSYVTENHGFEGPVHTSFNTLPWTPLEESVYQAGVHATGLNTPLVDPWAGDHLGYYRSLGAVYRSGPHKGKRSYAARAYLEGVLDRPNLHVLCNAHVTKIQLQSGRAVGVEFDHSRQHHSVKASREILLSAGAISSPHLLQLSGIGCRDVLKKAGIECQVDVPGVGRNLQEHTAMITCYELKPGLDSGDALMHPENLQRAMQQYTEDRAGPFASIGSLQAFAPVRPSLTDDEMEEIVRHVKAFPVESPFQQAQMEQVLKLVQDSRAAFFQTSLAPVTVSVYADGAISDQSKMFPKSHAEDAPQGFGFASGLQYTFSRGWVSARSPDPYMQPEINQNLLGHPADMVTAAAALAINEKVVAAPPLKDMIARRTYPRSEQYDLGKAEDRREFAKEVWAGQYHPCGSCAMGDVLDTRLRLKGVHGLRVADASVFPNHVSGNIMSCVYVVGEKAADMILEDHTS